MRKMEVNVKIEYKVYYRVQIKCKQYFYFWKLFTFVKNESRAKNQGCESIRIWSVLQAKLDSTVWKKYQKGKVFLETKSKKW